MTTAVRDTSLEAYDYVVSRGITGRQRREVAMTIYWYGALTRGEIAGYSGIPINAVCPRVKELLEQGHARELDKRPCEVSGFNAHPVELVRDPAQRELEL